MNARVRIIRSLSTFDIEYTYVVPEAVANGIDVGVFVDVPFGQSDRKQLGIVVGVDRDGKATVNVRGKERALKEIIDVNRDFFPLDKKQMELCEQMAEKYVCSAAESYKVLAVKTPAPLGKKVKILRLSVDPEAAAAYLGGVKRIKEGAFAAVRILTENPEGCSEKKLKIICDISASVVKRLIDDGIVERAEGSAAVFEQEDANEEQASGSIPAERKVTLNRGQQEALETLEKLLFSGKFSEFLLRGVTGSGKTEVYFKLIRKALAEGIGAMLLVPEIVLTEQMIKRVRAAFGDNVAVLHSRVTDKKKAEEYARLRSGEVGLVLGVRSCVFAPVRNLKLIIIDEEQEPSYKSFDQRPCYHAAEIAAMRMKQENGLVVYGSATPRVSTYFKAINGKMGYAFLSERAFAQSMPEVRIVDMKAERAAGNRSPVSGALASEIRKNIEKGEQSIIFLPRRGYSTRLVCGGCGKIIACRNCGIPMTYHKNIDRLVCHYCGTAREKAVSCPVCGSRDITGRIFGTEFAEGELARLFPDVQIVRMDTDTTRAVDGHKKILDKFENEKVPIMIGTQMVAKGLDFPDVTLVGVVNADSLLSISEYNAGERAFQLLTQVAGRAGRTPEKPGRCVLQTMDPQSSVIRAAAAQDYDAFAEKELSYRKSLQYPPFASMAKVTVSGADDRAVYDSARILREAIVSIKNGMVKDSICGGSEIAVLSQTRNVIPKIDESFLWCFLVKSENTDALLKLMNAFKTGPMLDSLKKDTAIPDGRPVKKFRVTVDVEFA